MCRYGGVMKVRKQKREYFGRFTVKALATVAKHKEDQGLTFKYEAFQSLINRAIDSGIDPAVIAATNSGDIDRGCKITSVRFDRGFYLYISEIAKSMGVPISKLITASLEYEGEGA
tara:strand:+ start:381 stop:728 length:348 start_codon:yes stop_codon:yes gene_type:complete